MKWKTSMYSLRSSRLPKASKRSPQKSPVPSENVIKRMVRARRRKTWLKEADDSILATDVGKQRDLIDIINSTADEEHIVEENGAKSVELADKGLDESDEDRVSDCSSVASGPSFRYLASPKKLRPPQGLCSVCRTLYQKAKRMKAPIKNKLLDNDPNSLTCDQWVLIKKWTPRRLLNTRGRLLQHVQLVSMQRSGQHVRVGESSACSRPHTLLQRNLRLCVKLPANKEKKKKKKKRTRNDSQGSHVAKQQRLHGNNYRQHMSISCMDDNPIRCQNSCPGFAGGSGEENHSQTDTEMTVELIPTSVTLETAKPRQVPPVQEAPKNRGGFRDLLAQLRHTSMIVRETC